MPSTPSLESAHWRARCAQRFADIDAGLSGDESRDLADQAWKLERMRAMPPEVAAEFVAAAMAAPQPPRFERRLAPR